MQRILVKAAPGLSAPQLTFGASTVAFTATPLFSSIGPQPALGAAAGDVWYVLTPPPGLAEENAWDVVPNLVVETINPSDFVEDVLEKIDEYFRAGVELIWVIHPKLKGW